MSANGTRRPRFNPPPAPTPGDGAGAGEPLPAPLSVSDNTPMSDFASVLASNVAGGVDADTSVPLGMLIAGRPDPEHDRVQLNTRARRDVAQTLALISQVSRRPVGMLVQDALMEYLGAKYPNELRAVHAQLYGR